MLKLHFKDYFDTVFILTHSYVNFTFLILKEDNMGISNLTIHKRETPHGVVLQLNYPVKEIFEILHCDKAIEFYDHLRKVGNNIPETILISACKKDYKDFIELNKLIGDSEHTLSNTESELLFIMHNLICTDYEFENPDTGKKGVKDYFGEMVVPAEFDGVIGDHNLAWIFTPAIVIKKT